MQLLCWTNITLCLELMSNLTPLNWRVVKISTYQPSSPLYGAIVNKGLFCCLPKSAQLFSVSSLIFLGRWAVHMQTVAAINTCISLSQTIAIFARILASVFLSTLFANRVIPQVPSYQDCRWWGSVKDIQDASWDSALWELPLSPNSLGCLFHCFCQIGFFLQLPKFTVDHFLSVSCDREQPWFYFLTRELRLIAANWWYSWVTSSPHSALAWWVFCPLSVLHTLPQWNLTSGAQPFVVTITIKFVLVSLS